MDMNHHILTGLNRTMKRNLHLNARGCSVFFLDAVGSQAHSLIQNGRRDTPMKGTKGVTHPIRRCTPQQTAILIHRKNLKWEHIADSAGCDLMKGVNPILNLRSGHSSRTPASSQMDTVS